jgi:serine/threonine protein kinase
MYVPFLALPVHSWPLIYGHSGSQKRRSNARLARATRPNACLITIHRSPKWSFQLESKLYLDLAYVNGSELFHHLHREQKFDEERSWFYAAEVLLALSHLHELNVAFQDLKPENILCVHLLFFCFSFRFWS